MSFQTRKTFFFQNLSSEDKLRYFCKICELFNIASTINVTDMFKAQKGSKDIVKIVQVTSVVQP